MNDKPSDLFNEVMGGKSADIDAWRDAMSPIRGGVHCFLSFDLVNSTQYKSDQPQLWAYVFTRFFEFAVKEVSDRLPRSSVWKYIGDEVVFFQRINGLADMESFVRLTSEALESTIATLWREVPESQSKLSVKAGAWVAHLVDRRGQDAATLKAELAKAERPENMILRLTNHAGSSPDFLGPEIDAGFRVAKYSERGIMVLSADLAWLLLKEGHGDSISRLRIVSYETMKGVWDDRHYPVVWYDPKWSDIGRHFQWDDEFRSPRIKTVLKKKCREDISELEKVFKDMGRQEWGIALTQAIRQQEDETPRASSAVLSLADLDRLLATAPPPSEAPPPADEDAPKD